uniref:Uncharacterized protein n=1 Tax=Chelonoidis abingdonii TaxID=106734 RepID=A0A8C0G5L5_CHEAB
RCTLFNVGVMFLKQRHALKFSKRYTSKGLSLKSPAAFAQSRRVSLSLAALYPAQYPPSSMISLLEAQGSHGLCL